jgi:hypothetical protein
MSAAFKPFNCKDKTLEQKAVLDTLILPLCWLGIESSRGRKRGEKSRCVVELASFSRNNLLGRIFLHT